MNEFDHIVTNTMFGGCSTSRTYAVLATMPLCLRVRLVTRVLCVSNSIACGCLLLQIQGSYKVSNTALQVLHKRAKQALKSFQNFEIRHVLR